jgi:hypothetical protein
MRFRAPYNRYLDYFWPKNARELDRTRETHASQNLAQRSTKSNLTPTHNAGGRFNLVNPNRTFQQKIMQGG